MSVQMLLPSCCVVLFALISYMVECYQQACSLETIWHLPAPVLFVLLLDNNTAVV